MIKSVFRFELTCFVKCSGFLLLLFAMPALPSKLTSEKKKIALFVSTKFSHCFLPLSLSLFLLSLFHLLLTSIWWKPASVFSCYEMENVPWEQELISFENTNERESQPSKTFLWRYLDRTYNLYHYEFWNNNGFRLALTRINIGKMFFTVNLFSKVKVDQRQLCGKTVID
jgi:hypothetical protein